MQVGKNAGRRNTFFSFGLFVQPFVPTDGILLSAKTITCTISKNQLQYARLNGMLLSLLRQPVYIMRNFTTTAMHRQKHH